MIRRVPISGCRGKCNLDKLVSRGSHCIHIIIVIIIIIILLILLILLLINIIFIIFRGMTFYRQP